MDSFDDTGLALMKFGVGQSVPRSEDPKLLRGEGRCAPGGGFSRFALNFLR